jgi:hypothetical protein
MCSSPSSTHEVLSTFLSLILPHIKLKITWTLDHVGAAVVHMVLFFSFFTHVCALITTSAAHIPHLKCTTLVMMKPMCLGDKAKMHQLPSIGLKCVYLILTIHSLINRTKVERCNAHQASHTNTHTAKREEVL